MNRANVGIKLQEHILYVFTGVTQPVSVREDLQQCLLFPSTIKKKKSETRGRVIITKK